MVFTRDVMFMLCYGREAVIAKSGTFISVSLIPTRVLIVFT